VNLELVEEDSVCVGIEYFKPSLFFLFSWFKLESLYLFVQDNVEWWYLADPNHLVTNVISKYSNRSL
jgi:hypothetical protein